MSEEEAAEALGLTRGELHLLLDTGALVFMSLSGSVMIRRKDVESYAAGKIPRPTLPGPELSERPPTLTEATECAFGVPLHGSQPRFAEPGWELDGETEIGCDVCEAPLWAFGKPWTSAVGVNYRFWAIACSECQVVSDFDVFDDQTQGWLRDWRKAIGKEPDRRAAAPPARAPQPAAEPRKSPQPAAPPFTAPTAQPAAPDTPAPVPPPPTTAKSSTGPRQLPTTATPSPASPAAPRPQLPEVRELPTKALVNLYVDLTALERSKYDEVTETMSEVYDDLSRQHPDLDTAAGRSWSRLRYLRTIDARARELEALASARDRLVANASRKREALNDIVDALDVGRTRTVFLHDTPAAAKQTLGVLRGRWVEAAFLGPGMPLGVGEAARAAFANGTLSAIVAAGDVHELAVPRADAAVLATTARTSEERRRLVAPAGPTGLCVSVMVRGTIDERVAAGDHALFPERVVTHCRWHKPGDALAALREPGSYTPEPSQRAVDRLHDEPLPLPDSLLSEPNILICRSCRTENPATRLRCSACYGRLSRRADLAPQR